MEQVGAECFKVALCYFFSFKSIKHFVTLTKSKSIQRVAGLQIDDPTLQWIIRQGLWYEILLIIPTFKQCYLLPKVILASLLIVYSGHIKSYHRKSQYFTLLEQFGKRIYALSKIKKRPEKCMGKSYTVQSHCTCV